MEECRVNSQIASIVSGQVIDSEGFRLNVGIIVCNSAGRVFWAKRYGQDAWQFPQGGILPGETPRQAMFRELLEETGISAEHVRLVGETRGWLRYRLPDYLIRRRASPVCIGQKQRWFMLRLVAAEDCVRLDSCAHPEFDNWRWVDYWHPLREVVFFKRHVYRLALNELAPYARGEARPRRRKRKRREN